MNEKKPEIKDKIETEKDNTGSKIKEASDDNTGEKKKREEEKKTNTLPNIGNTDNARDNISIMTNTTAKYTCCGKPNNCIGTKNDDDGGFGCCGF